MQSISFLKQIVHALGQLGGHISKTCSTSMLYYVDHGVKEEGNPVIGGHNKSLSQHKLLIYEFLR